MSVMLVVVELHVPVSVQAVSGKGMSLSSITVVVVEDATDMDGL